MQLRNLHLRSAIRNKFSNQLRFAQHLGISPSTVTLTISNRWRLTPEEKQLWAHQLGVKVSDIFPDEAASCEAAS